MLLTLCACVRVDYLRDVCKFRYRRVQFKNIYRHRIGKRELFFRWNNSILNCLFHHWKRDGDNDPCLHLHEFEIYEPTHSKDEQSKNERKRNETWKYYWFWRLFFLFCFVLFFLCNGIFFRSHSKFNCIYKNGMLLSVCSVWNALSELANFNLIFFTLSPVHMFTDVWKQKQNFRIFLTRWYTAVRFFLFVWKCIKS